ncbi:hypothetical protein Landi51_01043 [Colletotrichum acutatum]
MAAPGAGNLLEWPQKGEGAEREGQGKAKAGYIRHTGSGIEVGSDPGPPALTPSVCLYILCTVVGWHGVKEALKRLDEADEARTPPHSHHVVRQPRSFPERYSDAP